VTKIGVIRRGGMGRESDGLNFEGFYRRYVENSSSLKLSI
jgi:hypothetical protein